MSVHKISKGLNVPIAGEPTQQIDGVKSVSKVAVVAADFPTMKPKMMVKVGDTVACLIMKSIFLLSRLGLMYQGCQPMVGST